MPSSQTITNYYVFSALTRIKSTEVNNNFDLFRGHYIPIDPSTATADATGSYDLGSNEYYWRHLYSQGVHLQAMSVGATPPTGFYNVFIKESNGKAYKKDSSGVESELGGGGQGGINYITDYDAENGIGDWVTYLDSASAYPTDGTGGTPNVVYTTTSTNPLRELTSFLFVKDAANRQGEGVKYDFTIAAADKGKVLQGSFEYAIASGTFADDDLSVWIYDVTNARLIQPAPSYLKNHTLAAEKFPFEFQTSGDSTSYRLIIHVKSTSTSAYTVKFDNFNVGPQAKLYGSANIDWKQFTPSLVGFGTPTNLDCWYKINGDSMSLKYRFTSGTSTATQAQLPLPSGYTIGNFASGYYHLVGKGTRDNTGSSYTRDFGAIAVKNNSYLMVSIVETSGTNSGLTPQNGSSFTVSGDTVSFFIENLPINGLSSSQIMSSDASTRVVGMRASAVPTGTLAASFNDVIIGTVKSDTLGEYNSSTGVYTAKVPGYRNVGASTRVNSSGSSGAGTAVILRLIHNSTAIARKTEVVQATWSNATLSPGLDVKNIWMKAGDTLHLDIYASLAATLSYDATAEEHWFSVEMSQGPSQIMASEDISVRFYRSTSQSIPDATETTFIYDTKDWDSHGAFNPSTGIFTAPISGEYEVIGKNLFTSGGGWGVGEIAQMKLIKNTSTDAGVMSWKVADASHSNYISLNGPGKVKLLAGETAKVTLYQNSGASLNTEANASHNWITIKRVGNY